MKHWPADPLRALALALLALGGLGLIQGAWIPAKALLAQHLIARAWEASRDDRDAPKRPWPWADTGPVARLFLDPEAAPLYVLNGASGEALAFGPGHVSSSARPGEADNVAIAGHRDTHFSSLRDLRVGDRIQLETHRSRTDYEVVSTRVVHESRIDLVRRTGHDELTLLTCYPFGALRPGGSLRYVVHARALERHLLAAAPSEAVLDGVSARDPDPLADQRTTRE